MKTKNWNFKKEFEAQKAGEKLELASSFFCFQKAGLRIGCVPVSNFQFRYFF